jgi:hypothetical protein
LSETVLVATRIDEQAVREETLLEDARVMVMLDKELSGAVGYLNCVFKLQICLLSSSSVLIHYLEEAGEVEFGSLLGAWPI